MIQSSQASEEISESEEEKENVQTRSLPGLIIGIEEPELYQHSDRQRHLATTLQQLTERGIEGVGNIQVIYSTHSPLMIDYQGFNQLRIFRKTKVDGDKPKETKITLASLRIVAALVETAKELKEYSISDGSLQQRLISMTPWMNEGFFAKLVVIVEGIRDRALVYGYATFKGVDFDREGISVIPCSGKDHMAEAVSIFKSLEIPQYAIWDSDFDSAKGTGEGEDANRNIQRCYACTPESFPNKITDDFACVSPNLELEFKKEIGEANFSKTLQEYSEANQLGKGTYVMENPIHVSQLLSIFKNKGLESKTLQAIFGEDSNQIQEAIRIDRRFPRSAQGESSLRPGVGFASQKLFCRRAKTTGRGVGHLRLTITFPLASLYSMTQSSLSAFRSPALRTSLNSRMMAIPIVFQTSKECTSYHYGTIIND